jgi:hypothetical protein
MKFFCVMLKRQLVTPSGYTNFIATRSLGRARYFAKRLPRKYRQIDVRDGRRKYVLAWSWL